MSEEEDTLNEIRRVLKADQDSYHEARARVAPFRESLTKFHQEATDCIRFINTHAPEAVLMKEKLQALASSFRRRWDALEAEFEGLRAAGITFDEKVYNQLTNGPRRIMEIEEMVVRL
jgi:hypothetical protein